MYPSHMFLLHSSFLLSPWQVPLFWWQALFWSSSYSTDLHSRPTNPPLPKSSGWGKAGPRRRGQGLEEALPTCQGTSIFSSSVKRVGVIGAWVTATSLLGSFFRTTPLLPRSSGPVCTDRSPGCEHVRTVTELRGVSMCLKGKWTTSQIPLPAMTHPTV